MIRDMLREHDERHRNIGHRNRGDIAAGKLAERAERIDKCEIRHSEESGKRNLSVHKKPFKNAEIDDFERVVARSVANHGEDRSDRITCKDPHDERNQLHHFFAVNRTKNRDGQRDKTAKHGNQLISARICRLKVIYRVTGKGKSDNGNRRSDDDGRQDGEAVGNVGSRAAWRGRVLCFVLLLGAFALVCSSQISEMLGGECSLARGFGGILLKAMAVAAVVVPVWLDSRRSKW